MYLCLAYKYVHFEANMDFKVTLLHAILKMHIYAFLYLSNFLIFFKLVISSSYHYHLLLICLNNLIYRFLNNDKYKEFNIS